MRLMRSMRSMRSLALDLVLSCILTSPYMLVMSDQDLGAGSTTVALVWSHVGGVGEVSGAWNGTAGSDKIFVCSQGHTWASSQCLR